MRATTALALVATVTALDSDVGHSRSYRQRLRRAAILVANSTSAASDSKAMAANTTSMVANSTQDADEQALQNFVMSCTVALSVQDESMLPTDQLQRFCESTDDVVECRLKLSGPLKEVHQRGGNMQEFCKSAYGWFQTKYGMYCPSQCEKLQCRSTCSWLADKKELDVQEQKLQTSSKASTSGQEELSKLEAGLVDAREEAEMRNRSVSASQVKLDRANVTLTDDVAEFQVQFNKSVLVDKNVSHFEELKQSLTLNQTEWEDKLSDLQMRMDKAGLTTRLRQGEWQRLKDKLSVSNTRLTITEDKLQQNIGQTRDLQQVMTEEEQKLAALEERASNGTAEVAGRRAKLEVAQQQLQAARGSDNETEHELDVLQDLVRQQRERFEQATTKFATADKALKKQEMSMNHVRQDTARFETEAAAIRNESDTQRREVANLNDAIVAKFDEVESSRNASDGLKEQAADDSDALAAVQEALGNATRTLEFQLKLQRDEHNELEKARSEVQQARSAVELMQATLDQELSALQAAASRLEVQLSKVVQSKSAWERDNADLVSAMRNHSVKVTDLTSRKPDIVRMHGLGFIELFGA